MNWFETEMLSWMLRFEIFLIWYLTGEGLSFLLRYYFTFWVNPVLRYSHFSQREKIAWTPCTIVLAITSPEDNLSKPTAEPGAWTSEFQGSTSKMHKNYSNCNLSFKQKHCKIQFSFGGSRFVAQVLLNGIDCVSGFDTKMTSCHDIKVQKIWKLFGIKSFIPNLEQYEICDFESFQVLLVQFRTFFLLHSICALEPFGSLLDKIGT